MALTDVLGAALPAVGSIWGPAGTAIGSFAGGLVQNAAADSKKNEWNKLDSQIPLNDPQQQQFLSKVEGQERQYRMGADPNTSLANALARQAGGQTQTNLLRAGGPGTVQNLLSSQNVTNRALASNAAQAAGMADNMLGAEGSLINLMAQRRYDRQRYRRDIAQHQAEQGQQDANNQMMASIGMIPTLVGGLGGIGTGINKAAQTGYRGGPALNTMDVLPTQISPPPLAPQQPLY